MIREVKETIIIDDIKLELYNRETDREYVLYLNKISKYEKDIDIEFLKTAEKNLYLAYIVYGKIDNEFIKLGLVSILLDNGLFILDGYLDHITYKKYNFKKSFSYLSAKLLIDYLFDNNITDNIYSVHSANNKPADLLCYKLGFRIFDKNLKIDNIDYFLNVYLLLRC